MTTSTMAIRSSVRHRCVFGRGDSRLRCSSAIVLDKDFVVPNPRHSGFYATPLDSLLEECGARQLVLTGISAQRGVMHRQRGALAEFELVIPRDANAFARPSGAGF